METGEIWDFVRSRTGQGKKTQENLTHRKGLRDFENSSKLFKSHAIFKTFCHSLMILLRAVINSRGLIRRKNCSRKRKLPQKLVPWSKLYIVHSHLKFWRKMLTTIQKATLCTPNYNTLNDNAILVILFSDVVFTVFHSDERIKFECDF